MKTENVIPGRFMHRVWWDVGHSHGWRAEKAGEDASSCPKGGKPTGYIEGWRDGWASARLRKMGRIASPNGKAWDEWEGLCQKLVRTTLTSRSGESKTLYGKAAPTRE